MLLRWNDHDQYTWLDGGILAIDVERFLPERNFGWSSRCSSVLQWYKDWFQQLVDVAKLMQQEGAVVYISN